MAAAAATAAVAAAGATVLRIRPPFAVLPLDADNPTGFPVAAELFADLPRFAALPPVAADDGLRRAPLCLPPRDAGNFPPLATTAALICCFNEATVRVAAVTCVCSLMVDATNASCAANAASSRICTACFQANTLFCSCCTLAALDTRDLLAAALPPVVFTAAAVFPPAVFPPAAFPPGAFPVAAFPADAALSRPGLRTAVAAVLPGAGTAA